jgi:hypothetical protein
MTTDQLTTIHDGPGNVFVYAETPSSTSLIAWHCPDGPATDLFGTHCQQGDWCSDEYSLIYMTEVWPGVMLRKSLPQPPIDPMGTSLGRLPPQYP